MISSEDDNIKLYLKLYDMLVIFLNRSSITFRPPTLVVQFKLSLCTFILEQRVGVETNIQINLG